jgi:hypothetical protein
MVSEWGMVRKLVGRGFPRILGGYMRVSTSGDRQVLGPQRDPHVPHLAAGIDMRHLFEDRVAGSRGERAGLTKALAFIKPGDCLVVWKLRLAPARIVGGAVGAR